MRFTRLDKFAIGISAVNSFIGFIFVIFVAWYDFSLYERIIASHSVVYDIVITCIITFSEILIYNGKLNSNSI